MIGWYEEGRILAVIFAELNVEENVPVAELLRSKIETVLSNSLGAKAAARIVITTHIFPESWNQNGTERPADLKLYPDLSQKASKKRLPIVVKRVIDVLGSAVLLLLLSPILVAITVAIKLTSKGPVIFEQERLGQFGTKFKCLKFRTMYTNNDPKIHREYVQNFIAGQTKGADPNGTEPAVYKLTNDPRVTASADSCGKQASMSFRNSGMFCVERCPLWVLGLRFLTSSKCTITGIVAASSN